MPKGTTASEAVLQPGCEIEIKFRTSRDGLQRVLTSPLLNLTSPLRSQTLRTVYYDTRSLALRSAGLVLRLRKAGRAMPLLCLKSRHAEAGQPFRRIEIEVRCPRGVPDLDLFDAGTAARLREAAGEEVLEAQFEIRTKRRTLRVPQGSSDIEIAIDDGVIAAGGRTLALFEVELELKTGQDGDLIAFARALVGDLPLALDFVSKGEKGFRLSNGETAEAIRATPIRIDSKAPLDVAIHAIVSNTLAHFTANWACLRECDDADAIHQLRVALRRLRSALKMLGPALPQPQCEALREGARRIASSLAPARDFDVFGASVEEGPAAQRPDLSGGVLTTIEERRRAAYVEARNLFDGSVATSFVLDVQSFLAAPGWRSPVSRIEARIFARKALTKLHRRVFKRAEGFPSIPDKDRHELRIALKNLRYAIEFLGSVFHHKRARKIYAVAVSELQDLLGTHNDEVTAQRLLEDPELLASPSTDFLLGWYARGAPAGEKNLRKYWKKFRQAEPFWE